MKNDKLAKLVLEWEKIDDEVAEKGWGGDRDGRWDNAKTAMVAEAVEIVSGNATERRKESELEIVHGRGKNGITGIGFSIHPASGENEGYATLRMIPSSECTIAKDRLGPIRLYFHDLCSILSVIDGLEPSATIVGSSGSRSLTLHVRHKFGYNHGFLFALDTELDIVSRRDHFETDVEFVMDPHLAIGLRSVMHGALLLVGCSLPKSMRKAGE